MTGSTSATQSKSTTNLILFSASHTHLYLIFFFLKISHNTEVVHERFYFCSAVKSYHQPYSFFGISHTSPSQVGEAAAAAAPSGADLGAGASMPRAFRTSAGSTWSDGLSCLKLSSVLPPGCGKPNAPLSRVPVCHSSGNFSQSEHHH